MSRRIVGVYVALSAEARAIVNASLPPRTVVPVEDDALIWVGGIGAAAATRGSEALLKAGARALMSVGTAAGLAPNCTPGTLILPDRVLPPGQPPVPVDPVWSDALRSALGNKVRQEQGAIANTDTVLEPQEKQVLYQRTGAIAADMESAAVAAASVTFNVPLMVVRVISDGVGDVIPPGVINAVDEFGRPRYGRLLGTLARRPQDIRSMLALAGGLRAACRTLRAVVRCTGPGFHCPQ